MSHHPASPKHHVDVDKATKALEAFFDALALPDHARAETAGSAARVARLYADTLCAGYAIDPRAELQRDLLASTSRDRIVVRGLELRTTCPHHLLPARGTAAVWVEPTGAILGLGAYGRVLSLMASRLILQETLTTEYANALWSTLKPKGLLVALTMSHGCMVVAGECAEGSSVGTYAALGDVPDSAYTELGR